MKRGVISKNTLIVILILIIILLLVIFYLFDEKNIFAQQYLKAIYSNSIELHKKYKLFINENAATIYKNDICVTNNFLNPDFHSYLKKQFDDKKFKSKDFIVRKATGIDYFDLHKTKDYNGLLELYYSSELINYLEKILKKPIQRTPAHDANSCSLLIYNNKGDFIDWHKDASGYYGDRYVVLITIINENSDKNGLSQNEFIYKKDDVNYPVKFQENSVAIFKGSEILHKSTAIDENERRILLSMTFCDICQEKKNIIQYGYEKIKNFAIYGK
jgi:hypothetical protein